MMGNMNAMTPFRVGVRIALDESMREAFGVGDVGPLRGRAQVHEFELQAEVERARSLLLRVLHDDQLQLTDSTLGDLGDYLGTLA